MTEFVRISFFTCRTIFIFHVYTTGNHAQGYRDIQRMNFIVSLQKINDEAVGCFVIPHEWRISSVFKLQEPGTTQSLRICWAAAGTSIQTVSGANFIITDLFKHLRTQKWCFAQFSRLSTSFASHLIRRDARQLLFLSYESRIFYKEQFNCAN